MIGIIYKFTILVKYKMNGYKPFYVGQHVDKGDFESYWGSGSIWEDFVDKLRNKYPTCWEKFIKREVLYKHECSQKALDNLKNTISRNASLIIHTRKAVVIYYGEVHLEEATNHLQKTHW